MTSRRVTFSSRRFSFYTGAAAVAPSIPGMFPVGLGGIGYIIDDVCMRFEHRSVPILKQQLGADQGEPGETVLSPEAAWRRTRSSWHLGAGQDHADLPDSSSHRFRSSKGVNPWRFGELSLLADTTEVANLAATTYLASAGGVAYYNDAAQSLVRLNADGTTTNCTGEPAANVSGMVGAGDACYVAFTASGIYKTTAGGTVFASFVAGTYNLVGWAKGRVLAANNDVLYDVSTGAAVTLLDHADSAFRWTAIADGIGHAYAGGNSSDVGSIYRLAVKSDGSGLDVPVVAGRLPDGEKVMSLYGYAGALLIGTNYGFRVAEQNASGDLTIGPLVELSPGAQKSVRCFVGRGQYVWFGWEAYDATSTGLGRIDLENFTSPLVPAYASDLMVTGVNAVTAVTFFDERIHFIVQNDGLWREADTLVTSGTLDSGVMNFGIAESKIIVGGATQDDGIGTIGLSMSTDESATFDPLSETGESQRGDRFETRLTLTRATSTTGPTVKSGTLRAYVVPEVTELILIPIRLAPLMNYGGVERAFDVPAERTRVRDWWRDKTLIAYQESGLTFSGIVQDFQWKPEKAGEQDPQWWVGTLDVLIKVVT